MNKSNKVFFLFLCFITGFAFAAPEVESVAISGDKLIVTGHKFLDIDGLILSDPQTGFKKTFKVESATESEIVGTAVDNQKIKVASLMNLIIDTAKGETTYPVSFSLQKDAVTNPTIKNGAITPEKFIGVTTPNPPDQTVLTWDEPTQSFIFTSSGSGTSGVSDNVLGPGITGAPNTASGSVPISVDTGQTGEASKTKIPYFNSSNKIILDSTNSPTGALSGLSFKDGTLNFDISNDNALRIDSNAAKDLLVLDVDGNLSLKGPVTVGGFDVCLSSGNCFPSSGLTEAKIISPSDEKLKKNIKSLNLDVFDVLDKLNPVSFEWKDQVKGKLGTQFGFVAQEVEKVLPNLVITSNDGRKGVDEIAMISILMEAIKKQQKQIAQLQEKGTVDDLMTNSFDGKAGKPVGAASTMREPTGTTYTLAASDCGNHVALNNATAITVSVPALTPGCEIGIVQTGAGQVKVTGAGIKVGNIFGLYKTRGQYSVVTVKLINSSLAVLVGDVN